MSRVSSGVAGSRFSACRIDTTRFTWSELLLDKTPGPSQSESSRPTRTFPPHRCRHRGEWHLAFPGTQYRPVVVVSEQPVCRALHVQHVFGMCADTAEQPKHRLDQ